MHSAAWLDDGNEYLGSHSYNWWDAHMLQGCKCDPGWAGYDCSQRCACAAARARTLAPSLTHHACAQRVPEGR